MESYFNDLSDTILEEAADEIEAAGMELVTDGSEGITDIDRVADISDADVESIDDEELYDADVDAGILADDDDYQEYYDTDDHITYIADDDSDDDEDDDEDDDLEDLDYDEDDDDDDEEDDEDDD